MSVPVLTDLGRRVLAHLPVWAQNEKQLVAEEGGPDVSVRSYPLDVFTVRLAEDPGISPALDETQVVESLTALKTAGLAEETGGEWKMTKLGYEALTAPVEDETQSPGAVVVDVNPAQLESSAV